MFIGNDRGTTTSNDTSIVSLSLRHRGNGIAWCSYIVTDPNLDRSAKVRSGAWVHVGG